MDMTIHMAMPLEMLLEAVFCGFVDPVLAYWGRIVLL
jgi:hypothetical protein